MYMTVCLAIHWIGIGIFSNAVCIQQQSPPIPTLYELTKTSYTSVSSDLYALFLARFFSHSLSLLLSLSCFSFRRSLSSNAWSSYCWQDCQHYQKTVSNRRKSNKLNWHWRLRSCKVYTSSWERCVTFLVHCIWGHHHLRTQHFSILIHRFLCPWFK